MHFTQYPTTIFLTFLGFLGVSSEAQALSCDEIMNLVQSNVPEHIVTAAIRGSGKHFTTSDIDCLKQRHAPESVINTALTLSFPTENQHRLGRAKDEQVAPPAPPAPPAQEPQISQHRSHQNQQQKKLDELRGFRNLLIGGDCQSISDIAWSNDSSCLSETRSISYDSNRYKPMAGNAIAGEEQFGIQVTCTAGLISYILFHVDESSGASSVLDLFNRAYGAPTEDEEASNQEIEMSFWRGRLVSLALTALPNDLFGRYDVSVHYAPSMAVDVLIDRKISRCVVGHEKRPVEIRDLDLSSNGGCGISTDHDLACWGSGFLQEAPRGHFATISVSSDHACGVQQDGVAKCWGSNTFGELNVPDGTYQIVEVGDGFSCGILVGGEVKCWGDTEYQDLPEGERFSFLRVGKYQSVGQTIDGKLAGSGILGVFVVSQNEGSSFVDGDLSDDGMTFCSVFEQEGQYLTVCTSRDPDSSVKGQWSDFKKVSTNRYNACGLQMNGRVSCWGTLNFTPPTYDFVELSVGEGEACGLTTGGIVRCWGQKTDYDRLGLKYLVPKTPPQKTPETSKLYGCGLILDSLWCWE